MDWFAAIDIYCERTASGFWNEPLNAWSNLSFIIAALWAAIEIQRRPGQPIIVYILTGLCFMIGIGSFLFHTFANTWSELADVIPIWSFVAIYIFAAIGIIGGVPAGKILRIALIALATLVVVFLAMSGSSDSDVATLPGRSILNGSEQYAPALFAMLVLSFVTWRRSHPLALWFICATGMFLISLAFRSVDLHLCAQWPLGTHQMWHILNGLMLALLMQALIRHRSSAGH